jgi:hypothetical protein
MDVDGEKPDIGFRKNGYLFIVPPGAVATERCFPSFDREVATVLHIRRADVVINAAGPCSKTHTQRHRSCVARNL